MQSTRPLPLRFAAMATIGAVLAVGMARAAGASDDGGSAAGTIVLESGRLAMPLARAVEVRAVDFQGNPVGRVHYTASSGATLRYDVEHLPLGQTLLIELEIRPGSFPETRRGPALGITPTLARNDHSSPLYAFVLGHASPRKAPLDFRVAASHDASPAEVSQR